MRDVFGADTSTISEGAPAATPPMPAGVLAPTPPVVVAPPGPTGSQPTLAQAVDKAVAKAAADQTVAVDPQAVHAVNLATTHPTVLGSTAAGAAIGTAFLPGPGTLVGAIVGFLGTKYQVAGDPLGKAVSKVGSGIKKGWQKIAAPAQLPHLTTASPPAPPHGQ